MSSRPSALSLYRSILRIHSKAMPPEMRALGDAYVKAEFRLHKSVQDEKQLNKFFTEWTRYVQHIESVARARETLSVGISDKSSRESDRLYSFGADLDHQIEMTDEQKLQLEKLKKEAENAGT